MDRQGIDEEPLLAGEPADVEVGNSSADIQEEEPPADRTVHAKGAKDSLYNQAQGEATKGHLYNARASPRVLLQRKAGRLKSHVQWAVRLSVFINAILMVVKVLAYYWSGSYAVFSSMVDTGMDLLNMCVLFAAEHIMQTPSDNFPAGKTRLEPLAVIVNAVLMCALSLGVAQMSAGGLWTAIHEEKIPELEVNDLTMGILVGAVVGKYGLFLYCRGLRKVSGTCLALAEDHWNDILSNATAVLTATVAARNPQVWWLDPAGAISISCYIMWSWGGILKEQVEYVIGKKADEELTAEIEQIIDTHHAAVQLDQLRVYHTGRHFLAEIEVIMPRETILEVVHDVSLSLQHKVEKVHAIERAFVHVDYQARDYQEHKTPRLL